MTELGFKYYNRRFISTQLLSHYRLLILIELKCNYYHAFIRSMTLSFIKLRDKLDSGIGNIQKQPPEVFYKNKYS